ncbi:hypothetical protein FQN51_003330 [Onygenales sp. PD_10]|nr:hypothetical protein FQN51_003330 [Onygenales sp. PD_10]
MAPSTRSTDRSTPPPYKPPIILTLPNELLLEIARHIGPSLRTLHALSLTCRTLYYFADPLLYAVDAEKQHSSIPRGTSKAINHAIRVPSVRILKHALAAGASVRSMDHRSTSGFQRAMKARADVTDDNQQRQLLDEILMLMITDGDADVNDPSNKINDWIYGWTPVEYAVCYGMTAVVKALIEKGARVRMCALMQNICERFRSRGRFEKTDTVADCVEEVVRAGADVDERDRDYGTSLHLFATSGWDPEETGWMGEVLRLFIRLGANLDAVDREGATPLGRAVDLLMADVRYLGWIGELRNSKKELNESVLRKLNVVRLLLEHGADATLVREPVPNALVLERVMVGRMLKGVCKCQESQDNLIFIQSHLELAFTQPPTFPHTK